MTEPACRPLPTRNRADPLTAADGIVQARTDADREWVDYDNASMDDGSEPILRIVDRRRDPSLPVAAFGRRPAAPGNDGAGMPRDRRAPGRAA